MVFCIFISNLKAGTPNNVVQVFALCLITKVILFPGAAVGILLDDDTSGDSVQTFESLIAQLTAMRQSQSAQAPATDSQRAPVSHDSHRVPVSHDNTPTRSPPVRPAEPPRTMKPPGMSALFILLLNIKLKQGVSSICLSL